MTVRIIVGDALDQLRLLPAESVHCCVTSPPYYGLRDYGTAQWEGGDAACAHIAPATGPPQNKGNNNSNGKPYRAACICGARRIDSQIGLEPTPDEYIAALVAVFHEVRRVLRPDGTCWVNIGDSYAGSGKGGNPEGSPWAGFVGNKDRERSAQPKTNPIPSGIKPKDLIGIPWMLAFALRADGWWLRQDIIWAKPNPMPESVTDRCTKAHEYLFLLSKSERYWFDADAIREEIKPSSGLNMRAPQWDGGRGDQIKDPYGNVTTKQYDEIKGANRRSVWTVASEPFAEAHFATFPPPLIKPCILAGCPAVSAPVDGIAHVNSRGDRGTVVHCSEPRPPSRGVVLDPFAGAGTTGLVADRLGRDAILIELNPLYAGMAERRIWRDGPLFADVAIETMELSDAAE